MLWGYAGVWPGSFLKDPADPLGSRLRFLVEHGLQVTGVGVGELRRLDERRRGELFEYVAEHGLCLTPHAGCDFFASEDHVKRRLEEAVAAIGAYKDRMRAPLVVTGVASAHRFMRSPPLEKQLELLCARLGPLARACHEMGLGLGIENHGDYYCRDLVELCQRTPHLSIFLDTGNTYLIGEPSLPAIREAAPYTIGTHFKDHHVRPRPEARPLHFEVGPSVLGEGDVGLRQAHALLLEHAPAPEKLVMEIEMIPPRDLDPLECLRRSLAFVRGLPEPTV